MKGSDPRLAILGPVDAAMARGIADGMQLHGRWRIDLHHLHGRWAGQLRRRPPDALLVYGGNRRLLARLTRFDGPAINYSGMLADSPLPRVHADDAAIGEWAARHLLERGYRDFAFCGYGRAHFSHERLRGFRDALAGVGCEPASHQVPGGPGPREDLGARLGTWLDALPRPCAVFAGNDDLARALCEAALGIGRRVPEDLAILGVDDGPACQLSPVPLSSIVHPGHGIGRVCIAALARALRGEPLPAAIRLPPTDCRTRASTDVPAIGDPRVAMAVAWIRQHLGERFGIDDLARSLAVGRRTLELAFARELGRSPRQELERRRIDLARRLLADGGHEIDAVARRCGYRDRHRFTAAFTRVVGTAPGRWRTRTRNPRPSGHPAEAGSVDGDR